LKNGMKPSHSKNDTGSHDCVCAIACLRKRIHNSELIDPVFASGNDTEP